MIAPSYDCTANDTLTVNLAPFAVSQASGTQFTLTLEAGGTKTGTVRFICVGN